MDTKQQFATWLIVAGIVFVGAWVFYHACRWIGRWIANVFFGDVEGGRK